MKVYSIEEYVVWDPETRITCAIFSSREKAEKVCLQLACMDSDIIYTVQEWEVDKLC